MQISKKLLFVIFVNVFLFTNVSASPISALTKPISKFFNELFSTAAPKVLKEENILLKSSEVITREITPISKTFKNTQSDLIDLYPANDDINFFIKAKGVSFDEDLKPYYDNWNTLRTDYPEYYQVLSKELETSVFSKNLLEDDLVLRLAKSEYILWTSLFSVALLSSDLEAMQGGQVKRNPNTFTKEDSYQLAVRGINCLQAYQLIRLRLPDLTYEDFYSVLSTNCPSKEPDHKALLTYLDKSKIKN